ncbi:YigZ family protein [uncultured Desulfuromonas sp.]|uniref:YigZ family protein n=1 Tax=uncultured Desulfuromonas sp. TaxID=181013 RepID=UPI00262DB7A0|nr:YigZ family protein [uncultured Desulfuromonas sp.]
MTAPDRYPIPARQIRTEIEVRRSRFVATISHAPSEAEARAFVARVKAEFPDASHNCWAFAVGPPGDTGHTGMSDDGEPHGTAGRPMLTALLHGGVGDIGAVVTRYFGGVKLGKGGMARAYTEAVLKALAELPLAERREWARLGVSLDYGHVAGFERMLPSFEAKILSSDFACKVAYRVELPRERVPAFTREVADLTGGKAALSDQDE